MFRCERWMSGSRTCAAEKPSRPKNANNFGYGSSPRPKSSGKSTHLATERTPKEDTPWLIHGHRAIHNMIEQTDRRLRCLVFKMSLKSLHWQH